MVDEFLIKRFNIRTYNCWDLTREFWLRLTGEDLGSPDLIHYAKGEFEEVVDSWDGSRYREIKGPASPCIVLMQRPRHIPHVGVYYTGRVLHIKRSGVQFQPLEVASLGFSSVRFYLPCK